MVSLKSFHSGLITLMMENLEGENLEDISRTPSSLDNIATIMRMTFWMHFLEINFWYFLGMKITAYCSNRSLSKQFFSNYNTHSLKKHYNTKFRKSQNVFGIREYTVLKST